jgi:surface protein
MTGSHQINTPGLISAFNTKPQGTIFNASIVTTYAPGTFPSGNIIPVPSVSNFVPRQIPTNLSLSQTSLTKNTLDADFSLFPLITSNNLTGLYSFSSSDPQFASVNSSSGLVNLRAGGPTTITVSQGVSSDNVYAAATPVDLTLQVNKVVPLITVEDIPDKTPSDEPFTIVPSSDSGGTYTFSSSNTDVATVNSNGVVTIEEPGDVILTVSQAASSDGVFAAAVPVSKAFTVLEPSLTLAANGTTVKYIGNANDVPPSAPKFVRSKLRENTTEWFAVVDNRHRQAITKYAKGTDTTTFRSNPNDPNSLVPFNNIVTTLMTDMNSMFLGAVEFDQPLNSWDTSAVINMSSMFLGAVEFDQPLNSWNTSAVINMSSMFWGATKFNQSLNSWNVSSVENMTSMFFAATSFNEDLNSWDVSSVTNMSLMFGSASDFDQPLNSWNTSAVTNMSGMFNSATSFDRPLDSWNTSAVINMSSMFWDAIKFNRPLSSWDVSSVYYMDYMFNDATLFNQDISGWNVSSVTPKPPTNFSTGSALTVENTPGGFFLTLAANNVTIQYIGNANDVPNNMPRFLRANPHGTGDEWFAVIKDAHKAILKDYINNHVVPGNVPNGLSSEVSVYPFFTPAGQSAPVIMNNIITTLVTDMSQLFFGRLRFNNNLDRWDTSNVTNMQSMFSSQAQSNSRTYGFNHPSIQYWNTSKVQNFGSMFANNYAFQQDVLNGWDTSSATDMGSMFAEFAYNLTLTNWNTSNVINMENMFRISWQTNDVSMWDVTNVTNWVNFKQGTSHLFTDENIPPKFRDGTAG